MSSLLWKYYLEDDVDRFRQLLETATFNVRNTAQKGGGGGHNMNITLGILGSSPGASFGTSPGPVMKSRKVSGMGHAGTPGSGPGSVSLTRADINWRDNNGLAILHHAASSTSDNATGFAQALIDHPLVDLYLQDLENGWTALHRAFYFGNITIARAILDRDAENALSGKAGGSHNVLGLIKIKDREGHGPLDLYAATIQDRTLHPQTETRLRADSNAGSDVDFGDDNDDESGRRRHTISVKSIGGDECFTFGSNRNITLGFGDEDDRQWPERITLRRPDHLLQRFHREYLEQHGKAWSAYDQNCAEASIGSVRQGLPVDSIPWTIKSRPLVIQDVHMSKLHTAVLTDDPESNLYICGHGPGGRLGLGHESSQFHFACVEGAALSGKRVATVALGQNHTLAVSDEGEIFSWGSNGFGQLGYSLPKSGLKDDDPVQTLPRQIFGPLKRESLLGVAASRIHSVAFTSSSLFTWGKNEGQLGIVDSDARSLDCQVTPRKVAASLFSSPIVSVCAIDRATICLLSGSHEVWVFANYGYAKIQFPLDRSGFSTQFLERSFMFTDYDKTMKHIKKITSGGDTICAMSSHGEVYTLAVSQPQVMQSANASTTNPAKIKGALSQPSCIWSLKSNNMAARDVGVDADGSIIITTEEGSVWKRSRRAKIKDATGGGPAEYKPKDYKFSRISGLTRVIAVRSSSYGAYAAIRRDCDVTKSQIAVEEPNLWSNVFPLLCFKDLQPSAVTPDSEKEDPEPRFWQGRKQPDDLTLLKEQMLVSKDLEKELKNLMFTHSASGTSVHDVVLRTTVSDIALPAHQVILAGRSKTLRDGFYGIKHGGDFSVPDLLVCERDSSGTINLVFSGIDPLTLINLVLYLYTDNIVAYWHHTRQAPRLAHRYRTIRTELMKVAASLRLHKLEPAARQMVEPVRAMLMDMELAYKDSLFFDNFDAIVELADEELPVHSVLLCQRCPFFEGLFMGRAGGRWLDERRGQLNELNDAVRVDLKHIEAHIFKLVLRHIYADSGEEIFDEIVCTDTDEFLDFVMEVMSVANELMLDRLAQVCQKVIGRYVNVRNVSGLLNAIAPSSVCEFKDASLEYMCLSLEAVLHARYLDELDEDLLLELDEIVRDNQLAFMPFAKSGRAEAQLLEDHPELPALLERDRRAKLDAFNIRAKYQDPDHWTSNSFRGTSFDDDHASPSQQKMRRKSSNHGHVGRPSPAIKGKEAVDMLGQSIDEGTVLDLGAPAVQIPVPDRSRNRTGLLGSSTPDDVWYSSRGKQLASPGGTLQEHQAISPRLERSPLLAPSQATPSRAAVTPWGASPSPGPKFEMKDIMAQTSSSRVSNLSLGLAAAKQSTENSAPVPGSKLSQKERKKIQLQQQQAMAVEVARPTSSDGTSAKSSPWQQVPSGHRIPSLKDVMSTETQPSSQPSKQAIARSPATPQLTMRQTVANVRSTSSSTKDVSTKDARQSQAQRSVSGPVASAQPIQTSSPAPRPRPSPHQRTTPSNDSSFTRPARAPSPSSFPTIQSIRHQPRPVEPSLQLSMADILSMQLAEKESIKEAAAARSLQDIQAEQAFQEWWDREAKRLQEEQDGGSGTAKASGGSSKRGGKRGAIGRGGAKRGRGGADAGRRDSGQAQDRASTSASRGRGGDVGPSRGK